MTKKTDIDLLIFDLDGTLIESKWDIADTCEFDLAGLGCRNVRRKKFSGSWETA